MTLVFLLAFMMNVNASDYSITDTVQLMQEKKTMVEASSLGEDDFTAYDINLDPEIQEYIWNEANEYQLSYELLLSIAYVESKFDPSVVSWDGSSTGLYQINTSNTVGWLSEETDIENVNPKNPYHSTKMAAWYVNYLRNKYLKEGYSEETVMKRALTAYRYGIGASKKKSIDNGYVRAVLDYKMKLESGKANE